MKKTILELYALAVCFVTVVCAVVAMGIGIYDGIQIAIPEFTLPAYQHSRHQSNDAFFRGADPFPRPVQTGVDPGKVEVQPLSEQEETNRRLASYARALDEEQRSATQSLVIVLIVLCIDAAVFAIHWELARRSRETSIAAAN